MAQQIPAFEIVRRLCNACAQPHDQIAERGWVWRRLRAALWPLRQVHGVICAELVVHRRAKSRRWPTADDEPPHTERPPTLPPLPCSAPPQRRRAAPRRVPASAPRQRRPSDSSGVAVAFDLRDALPIEIDVGAAPVAVSVDGARGAAAAMRRTQLANDETQRDRQRRIRSVISCPFAALLAQQLVEARLLDVVQRLPSHRGAAAPAPRSSRSRPRATTRRDPQQQRAARTGGSYRTNSP